VRCRLAYGPADATGTHCLLHSIGTTAEQAAMVWARVARKKVTIG